MDTELAQLESRIEQLVSLYGRLKADNVELRGRLARLDAENRRLSDKLELATGKLVALLDKLPEA